MDKITMAQDEDFIKAIREERIDVAYYRLEHSQMKDNLNIVHSRAMLVLTAKNRAKTIEEKRLYLHAENITTLPITNDAEIKIYNDAILKYIEAFIKNFQSMNPSCRLIEGAIE